MLKVVGNLGYKNEKECGHFHHVQEPPYLGSPEKKNLLFQLPHEVGIFVIGYFLLHLDMK